MSRLSRPAARRPAPADLAPEEIAAYLQAHPAWLAENPDLYRVLVPPRRLHGEPFADHMAAMLQVERAHAAAMVAFGRAAAGLAGRVQAAVLALMRAADTLDCLTGALPGILGLDAVSLCAEGPSPGARPLPPGTLDAVLGSRDVALREAPDDAPLFHGEAARLARHDALVRVPDAERPTLLALVTRETRLLEPGQGTGALAFLGCAVGAALARRA